MPGLVDPSRAIARGTRRETGTPSDPHPGVLSLPLVVHRDVTQRLVEQRKAFLGLCL